MSEKLNQQLEQQDLEAMADQLLAEDAAKRTPNPARSWTIRPLPPFRRRPSSPQTRN